MNGRTHVPEIRPELCGTCRICMDGCPATVFKDLADETDTVRGRVAGAAAGLTDLPRCRLSCPVSQDIPGYLNCIAAGDANGALERILRDNPFPAVLGHVCHHPCEQACISGPLQRPPAIRELKRFASRANRPDIRVPDRAAKGSVAIIGAGPAGLAAAWNLRREGIRTVVFESLPLPGGLLASAIPPFRLPRQAIREDVQYILRHGVELRIETHIPPEELSTLAPAYDAVILACGAAHPRQPDIAGSRLPGVWQGIDFLRQLAFGSVPLLGSPVIVIGGGNVATDAARWAVRLSRPVSVLYRRDREEMPAYAEEVEACEAEGIELQFRSQPVSIEGDPRTGVRQVRVQPTVPGVAGDGGRRSFSPAAVPTRTVPAGTVILALGQEQKIERWEKALGIEPADRIRDSRLKDNIYAAGDLVTGPSTIVEAVAAGIECSRRILLEVFP